MAGHISGPYPGGSLSYPSYLLAYLLPGEQPTADTIIAAAQRHAIEQRERQANAPGGTATGTTGVPSLPDYSQVDDLIASINAANQAAQHQANLGRIPGAEALEAQSSQNIAGLLNPPSQFGEIDVPSAARAVQSGTVGSPFAGVTGIQLSETERLRRQALGQSQLSGAYARNPAAPIADPQALLTLLQQQAFQGNQNEAQRTLQRYLAAVQQQTALAVAALGGRRGGGGGPQLPRDYGRPPGAPGTPPSYRANIPGQPPNAGPPDWYGQGVENPFFGAAPGDVPYWYTGDPSELVQSPFWFPGGPGSVPYEYPGDPSDISGEDFWSFPPQGAGGAPPAQEPLPTIGDYDPDDFDDYA